MKKLTGTLALVLAVFSIFYFSNTALAGKAYVPSLTPSSQTVSVSNSDIASWNITLGTATDVRVEFKSSAPGSSFATITGFEHITSSGTYQKTAAQMYALLGNQYDNNVSIRVADNGSFDLSSTVSLAVQQ